MNIDPEIQRPFSRARAFTLVEVLIGTAVVGIMMAVLFVGLAQGYTNLNTSRQNLRATQILTQKMEAFRLCLWTNINNLPTTFVDYYNGGGSGSNGPSTEYYGTITVGAATNIPSSVSYYSQIKLVTVSVNWTNYFYDRPIPHTRQMQTLCAYNGLVNYIFGYTP